MITNSQALVFKKLALIVSLNQNIVTVKYFNEKKKKKKQTV